MTGTRDMLSWLTRRAPWRSDVGIRLERFRPSPFVLELDDPAAPPRRRYRTERSGTSGHFVIRRQRQAWHQCEYKVPMSKIDRFDPAFEASANDFLRWVHDALHSDRDATFGVSWR